MKVKGAFVRFIQDDHDPFRIRPNLGCSCSVKHDYENIDFGRAPKVIPIRTIASSRVDEWTNI